ncbi:Protein kinase catalytic incomplete domain containing protein [Pandoravirus quercus]|uniref:Protein kinase catalytic incomplete domain containing protein n=2 Tax=Pandoravirus TaxID=2060084 RepID=A0A2U7U8Q0_9VIRU|nr:Protein kinase catalytic incomplete domain containing protein [Pandoravirus quercus]AVK74765.1 Protein kinase catalytic incomplete domain containing protein [Pandoravirus quercus]QBZ80942.1 Protein kinase catalytic incomplete domain containing protein [Pandoravirus celtis]
MGTRPEAVSRWTVAWRVIDMAWKAIVYALAVAIGLCEPYDAVAALGPLVIKLARAATARPDLFLAGFIDVLRPLLQDCVPAEPIADLPGGATLLASGSVTQVYACPPLERHKTRVGRDHGSAYASVDTDSDDARNSEINIDDSDEGSDDGAGVFARRRNLGRHRRPLSALVVKVRRPTVTTYAAVDRAILVWFMRTSVGRALIGRACRRALAADAIDYLVAIAGDGLAGDMDLATEASNTERMRALFAGDRSETVLVPKTIGALSTPERLFMERIDGVPIARLSTAAARSAAARLLAVAVCRMVFEYGLLHGDIHEGNVLCVCDLNPSVSDARVRIALLDVGIVYEIDPDQRRLIALLIRTAIGVDAPDRLATCIYFGAARPGRCYAQFRQGIVAAVAAGRHGSNLGAFLDRLAVACADSGVPMDRDMTSRIAPLAAADSIARTFMAPSLTVVACGLYGHLLS